MQVLFLLFVYYHRARNATETGDLNNFTPYMYRSFQAAIVILCMCYQTQSLLGIAPTTSNAHVRI